MSSRRILGIAICVWVAVPLPARTEQEQPVRVAILFRAQKSYQIATSSLEAALQRTGYECICIELPKRDDQPGRERALRQLASAEPSVIATTGADVTSFVLEKVPKTPVVFFMVPNARDASFVTDGNPHRNRVAGVTTDVSPEDQIDWIARLRPATRNLAILHSSRTQRTVEAFRAAGRKRGITITTIEADKNEFPKAIEALNTKGCNGVLMIPDARIYNAATIKRLLLWGIRQKKPVWTFSASIVRAGAFAGQYADSQAIGRQAAELIQNEINGTRPSDLGLQYPRHVGRAVNERSAEMIDIVLNDAVIGVETMRFGVQP